MQSKKLLLIYFLAFLCLSFSFSLTSAASFAYGGSQTNINLNQTGNFTFITQVTNNTFTNTTERDVVWILVRADYFNSSEVNNNFCNKNGSNCFAAGNLSFNQTLTNTLYYSISNPSGFLNNTYNASYYLASNPSGFLNNTFNASYYLVSNPSNFTNNTLNDLRFYPLNTNPNAYQNTSLFTSINQTQFDNSTGVLNIIESWLRGIITGYGYITNSFNATYAGSINNDSYLSTYNASYYLNSNPSGFLNSTYNITYAGLINNNSYLSTFNASYYLITNPSNYYNSTSLPLVNAVIGAGTAGYIPLWNATNSINNSVIYQNGGNVGIGTTTPNASLEIYKASAGPGIATGGLVLSRFINGNDFRASSIFHTYRNPGSGDIEQLAFAIDSGNTGTPYAYSKIKMVIEESGNVGIGTTAPASKLDVQGNITVNSSIIRAAGSADLVINGNAGNVVIQL